MFNPESILHVTLYRLSRLYLCICVCVCAHTRGSVYMCKTTNENRGYEFKEGYVGGVEAGIGRGKYVIRILENNR